MSIFRLNYFLAFIFTSIFLCGCVTTQVKNTETNNNESIIFGRFLITGTKDINYKKVIVYFYSANGSPIVAKLDKEGYFYTKAPADKFYSDRVQY